VAVTSAVATSLRVMFMVMLLLGALRGFTNNYAERPRSVRRTRAQVGNQFGR
jgi:hypothetical protein